MLHGPRGRGGAGRVRHAAATGRRSVGDDRRRARPGGGGPVGGRLRGTTAPASAGSARPGSCAGWLPSAAAPAAERSSPPCSPTCVAAPDGAPSSAAACERPGTGGRRGPPRRPSDIRRPHRPQPQPADRSRPLPAAPPLRIEVTAPPPRPPGGPRSKVAPPSAPAPTVVLGRGGFADDTAPAGCLVAVPDRHGGWAVGETLAEARAALRQVPGRRSGRRLSYPLEVPPGHWDLTLQTTWVEPAYLEPDSSWCVPGWAAGPSRPAMEEPSAASSRRSRRRRPGSWPTEYRRPVQVVFSREDVVRLGPKRPPVAAGMRADGTGCLRVVAARADGGISPGRGPRPRGHRDRGGGRPAGIGRSGGPGGPRPPCSCRRAALVAGRVPVAGGVGSPPWRARRWPGGGGRDRGSRRLPAGWR